jgi:DNA-binding GntR family transcriptional regulator
MKAARVSKTRLQAGDAFRPRPRSARRSPKATAPGASALGSMCDRAYQFIKQRIITSEAPIGAQLSDQEIAERLGISRTPVREAILLLQREGFVEVIPRVGVRVRPLFLEDIRELYDILTDLETLAVGLLTARHPALEELKPLTEAVDMMKASLKGDDYFAWIDADERFHRGLFQLSGNRRLAVAGNSYRDQVQRAHVVALKLRPRPDKFVEGHAELMELIRRGDAEGARELHYAEWVRAREELMAAIARYGLRYL